MASPADCDVGPFVGNVSRVLVTGASGYIAGHCVALLQQKGFRVRGTVRSLSDTAKVQHLLRLCPDAKYELELVEADLTKPDTWAAAVDGCSHVLHVASPAPAKLPKNEDELVKPAVEGTLNVLRAAKAAGVLRVVVTSSNSAVSQGHPEKVAAGYKFTEKEWSNYERATMMHAYVKSKTLAERAAWDFCKANGMQLSTVLPTLVLGPVLNGRSIPGSVTSIAKLMNGSLPLVPDLMWGIVHVHDVAEAHLRAMLLPQAVGNRYLLCAGHRDFSALAALLRREFKGQGYSIPSLPLPTVLVRALAPVVPVFALVAPKLGLKMYSDGSKATRDLALEYATPDQAAIDAAHSLVEHKLVKRSSGIAQAAVIVGVVAVAVLLARYVLW